MTHWYRTPGIALALDADAWAHIDALCGSRTYWWDCRDGVKTVRRIADKEKAPTPARE